MKIIFYLLGMYIGILIGMLFGITAWVLTALAYISFKKPEFIDEHPKDWTDRINPMLYYLGAGIPVLITFVYDFIVKPIIGDLNIMSNPLWLGMCIGFFYPASMFITLFFNKNK